MCDNKYSIKFCPSCKQEKPLEEFNKKSESLDGRARLCRSCNRAYAKEYAQRRKENSGEKLVDACLIDDKGRECARCKTYKPWSEYNKATRSPTGYRSTCNSCRVADTKSYYEENKDIVLEKQKQYNKDNAEKIAARSKVYYEQNKEVINEKGRKWRKEHKDEIAAQGKEYRDKNREEIRQRTRERREANKAHCNKLARETYLRRKEKVLAYNREYTKRKEKEDPNFRLSRRIRNRIRSALNGISKSARTMELLGCTIEEFRTHLENQFEGWMGWDNYGVHRVGGPRRWSIEHTIPVSKFDLTTEEGQRAAFHYTNCKPLDSFVNTQKNNRTEEEYKDYLASLEQT